MYTANPKLVKQASPITELSYQEAVELSHFGAKVLYPPTVMPVLKKHIPIVIKNTMMTIMVTLLYMILMIMIKAHHYVANLVLHLMVINPPIFLLSSASFINQTNVAIFQKLPVSWMKRNVRMVAMKTTTAKLIHLKSHTNVKNG